MVRLKVTNLHKTYLNEGQFIPAVRGVSLSIEEGEFVTLLGPSGCGKSTFLRCIAGLETPEEGEIEVNGKVLYSSSKGISVPTHQRNLGMVFQSYAIWPFMNVFDNVAFPLHYGGRKYSKEEKRELVKSALASVQLEGFENRSATLLSGGQQQRVVLARALVYQPDVLLLDEPLSNLDARLRVEVRDELSRISKKFRLTVLFVTHDQTEALYLSDRIAVIRDGNILQEAAPRELYYQPQDAFVSQFVSGANQIRGKIVEENGPDGMYTVKTGIGTYQGICSSTGILVGDEVIFCIFPTSVMFDSERRNYGHNNIIEAKVEKIAFTGRITIYLVRVGDTLLEFQTSKPFEVKENEMVYISFLPEECRILKCGDLVNGHND
jgi:iron(III) transport system ATP-binding protein